jgi:hypothetical protein
MFQTRRPAGRIFYLVLAVVVAASGSRLYAAPQSGPALTSVVDTVYRADGSEAQGTLVITWPAFVSSTTVQVDAGMAPGSGYGIEVRTNDYGWGQANDRNLLGRFSTQTFNLARLAETQDYFLRLYDSSSPPKCSRYSAALHVDYPL